MAELSSLRDARLLGEINMANVGSVTWPSASIPGSALQADAQIARSQMAQVALDPVAIELTDWLTTGTLAKLGNSAGTPSGAFGITPGTHGSASPMIVGESANANSKTNYMRLLMTLPSNYDGGQTVTLRIHAKITANCNTAQTIDVEAYESDGEAGIGSDLCATAAETLTTSWADYDFTITPSGLVAGDILDIEVTGVANDTSGSSGGAVIQIGKSTILADRRG